jgi:ATP adenylyltransferase
MEYIRSAKGEPGPDEEGGCIFCAAANADDDRLVFVLGRQGTAFAILNAFPYNPGHLMVATVRHVGELEELRPEELSDASALLQRSVRALKATSAPDGFNVGMNLARVAGAGIPGHVHWHVVPRWNGDTNFVTVVGETRVLPELLSQTYEKLQPHFPA